MRQIHTLTSCSIVASYHALLFELVLVDMDYNCTRTGLEVCTCMASLPHVRKKNSFHKLIRMIKQFRTIHEILLTSNNFQTTVNN